MRCGAVDGCLGGGRFGGGRKLHGNWPVTAKLPPQFAKTACLALIDNGSAGSPHSGPVTGSGGMFGENLSGTFQVFNNVLVVNLQSSSDTGEVVDLSFIGRAQNGKIGHGIFNNPGSFVTPLTFGTRGGC